MITVFSQQSQEKRLNVSKTLKAPQLTELDSGLYRERFHAQRMTKALCLTSRMKECTMKDAIDKRGRDLRSSQGFKDNPVEKKTVGNADP